MKKSILVFTLALVSLTAYAQAELVGSEEAKRAHSLFQKVFASSCSVLPQFAICDFNLQDQILVTQEIAFDQATISATTLPSVHAEKAARNLSEKYNFDYQIALQSASLLEGWVKRLQAHANKTSQAEIESVYLSAIGVSQSEVVQMAKDQDHKRFDQIAEVISKKFRTSSRESKLFLESLLGQ